MINVLLVINSVLTRYDNYFWNFRLDQISHTIFWGAEGLGGGVRENNAYCFLLRMALLFLFIMVEFENVLHSPDLNMLLIFLVTKLFQKGTMFN